MNIGTPLSDSATRVMLLGAGELGKEVIVAQQRLGVESLAVDRYDNATDTLVEIERDGITKIIPTARAVQLTMNREGIRRLAAEELELPTSRYAFVDSLNRLQMAIDSDAGYPCIVKPVCHPRARANPPFAILPACRRPGTMP